MPSPAAQITGHLEVDTRRDHRVWVAKYRTSAGGFTRKVLGPAWAKDSGRRTSRGAIIWRAPAGTRPDGYLSPKQARAALEELLAKERTADRAPGRAKTTKSFGDATAAWLEYVAHEKQLAPTTLRRYRGIVARHLLPEFGASTPLSRITAERVDRYRDRLLESGQLSRHSMRQIFVALNAVLQRAARRKWIAHNPVVDVEPIPTTKASGEFNVLSPVQVEAVARAAADGWAPVLSGVRTGTAISEQRAEAWTAQRRSDARMYAAVIRVTAHTGLRMGELRALRWAHVDWANGVIHVQRNAPESAPAAEAEKAPKSGRVRSVPLTDVVSRELDLLTKRPHFTKEHQPLVVDRVLLARSPLPADAGHSEIPIGPRRCFGSFRLVA